MISSSVFDVTVNAFGDFVNEVFSGTDESQKAKLRTKLNQFSKISNGEEERMPDGQIVSVEVKKKILLMLKTFYHQKCLRRYSNSSTSRTFAKLTLFVRDGMKSLLRAKF